MCFFFFFWLLIFIFFFNLVGGMFLTFVADFSSCYCTFTNILFVYFYLLNLESSFGFLEELLGKCLLHFEVYWVLYIEVWYKQIFLSVANSLTIFVFIYFLKGHSKGINPTYRGNFEETNTIIKGRLSEIINVHLILWKPLIFSLLIYFPREK